MEIQFAEESVESNNTYFSIMMFSYLLFWVGVVTIGVLKLRHYQENEETINIKKKLRHRKRRHSIKYFDMPELIDDSEDLDKLANKLANEDTFEHIGPDAEIHCETNENNKED